MYLRWKLLVCCVAAFGCCVAVVCVAVVCVAVVCVPVVCVAVVCVAVFLLHWQR